MKTYAKLLNKGLVNRIQPVCTVSITPLRSGAYFRGSDWHDVRDHMQHSFSFQVSEGDEIEIDGNLCHVVTIPTSAPRQHHV